jgi:hypothetical protein
MGKPKAVVAESSSAAAARAVATKTHGVKKKILSKKTKPKPKLVSSKGKEKAVAAPDGLEESEEAALEAKRAEKKLKLEYCPRLYQGCTNLFRAEFKVGMERLTKCWRCRLNKMDRKVRTYKTDCPGERLDCGCLKERALLEMAMVKLKVVNNPATEDMKGYKIMTDAERYHTMHLLEIISVEEDSLSTLLDHIPEDD